MLLFGRKMYNELGYSGLTRGALELTGTRGRKVRIIRSGSPGESSFSSDWPLAINDAYTWPIEADTHQLSDDGWVRNYLYTQMREIYWDLGVSDVQEAVFDAFIRDWAFQ
jgi:hypothetical protein